MDTRILEARSRLVTGTRAFFLDRGYLETPTPILSPALIPESCLEVFRTDFIHPFRGRLPLWLAPSPEVWMKPLIAATGRSVFQICPCFRNAESIGRIHNPEFTMLEYYTVGASSRDSLAITEELFLSCASAETPRAMMPPFARMTMEEAFHEFAGLDLAALQEPGAMAEAARMKGLMAKDEAAWEDSFNQVFITFVEESLPRDRPLALTDYPAQIECLARNIPGTPWKDRWELYGGGIELANCYVEEASPSAVAAYLAKEGKKKEAMVVPHRVDPDYPKVFEGFPMCSGVAMGFDRFAMAMSGAASIQSVLPFSFESLIERFPLAKA